MTGREAVIITGGARRIGAALARHYASLGYGIALHHNNSASEAKAIQKEAETSGVHCEIFKQDLNDIPALDTLMGNIKKAFPNAATLINNASIFERASFMDTGEALFDRQITVNFKAPFFLTQAFARHFARGSVINILDTDIVSSGGSHFAYLLSKKALSEFTIMAARALGPAIRVNGICPGCILPSGENDEVYEQKLEALVPLKSHPSLGELTEGVVWLSRQPSITGQMIFVDGGKHVL